MQFHIEKISRRRFVQWTSKTAAGTSLIIGYGEFVPKPLLGATAKDQPSNVFAPNVFIEILSTDNKVRVYCHRSEMGQGARSGMTTLLCEELGIGIHQVEVVQAEGNAKYGDQNTDGSTSVRYNWDILRKAGAAARE